jgi:hypothetical protein
MQRNTGKSVPVPRCTSVTRTTRVKLTPWTPSGDDEIGTVPLNRPSRVHSAVSSSVGPRPWASGYTPCHRTKHAPTLPLPMTLDDSNDSRHLKLFGCPTAKRPGSCKAHDVATHVADERVGNDETLRQRIL